jgi:putative transposase
MSEYQVIDRTDSRQLAEFLAKEGQFLLPMVELVEQAQLAIDEVIDVTGRATIEAVLELSAQQVAGPKHPGKAAGPIRWHGRQGGHISLAQRKLHVQRPRLRRKDATSGGEVEIPAYEAMRGNTRLGQRMLEILLAGVSTRRYEKVLPEMADSVGVSKSAVSREAIEASEERLRELAERRFDNVDILIIYLDGIQFGSHHVLAAVGVDSSGKKHPLGLREGASENGEVAKSLLEDLVSRGVHADRRRLFVIDGSKALRAAIDTVFGSSNPVQRCRNHKMRNVLGHLPKELHSQTRSALRAAWRLEAKEGIAKVKKLADWLEKEHPGAAGSLHEGLEELFTINRLDLPASLRRCLGTTNIIDSAHSGMREKTRRITNWQGGAMAMRWAAASLLETEARFRCIMGHNDLWILKSYLDGKECTSTVANGKKAG